MRSRRLITQQEVEDLLWKHKIEKQMEEFMNLDAEEKREASFKRMNEKLDAMFRIMGIDAATEEAMIAENQKHYSGDGNYETKVDRSKKLNEEENQNPDSGDDGYEAAEVDDSEKLNEEGNIDDGYEAKVDSLENSNEKAILFRTSGSDNLYPIEEATEVEQHKQDCVEDHHQEVECQVFDQIPHRKVNDLEKLNEEVIEFSVMTEKADYTQKLYTRMRLWEFPDEYVMEPTDESCGSCLAINRVDESVKLLDDIPHCSFFRIPKIRTIFGVVTSEEDQKIDKAWDEEITKFKGGTLCDQDDDWRRVVELEDGRELSRNWLHVDMDAFYAAVETLCDSSLKGKPMAVGGMSMISTADYEARKIRKYDSNLLAACLDEAYLDITNVCLERGITGGEVAEVLKTNVYNETDLTCNAGVASNSLLAKDVGSVELWELSEVVKACAGKFHPIFQFFYVVSVKSLPTEPIHPDDLKPLNSPYDAQISVSGTLQLAEGCHLTIDETHLQASNLKSTGADIETSQETLPNVKDDMYLVTRCEVQSVVEVNNQRSFLTLNALNKFDLKYSGENWRQKLERAHNATRAARLEEVEAAAALNELAVNDPEEIASMVGTSIQNSTKRRKLGYFEGGTDNPIDDYWRCDPNWQKNRKRLADYGSGIGYKASSGRDGCFYVVTDSGDDDPVNPRHGTLCHVVIQTESLWIVFKRDMVITLKQKLIMNSFKAIDARVTNIHIANGTCITMQFVTNIIIHGLHVHDCKPTGKAMVRSCSSHYGWRTMAEGDGISIFGSSYIRVDHNSLSNCADGLVDAAMGSTAITISNNYFTHHNEVMLLGHSDSCARDKQMQVTIAYNHFGEDLIQRMPRCRHGYFHVVNNDYTQWEMYAISGSASPTINSQGKRYLAPINTFAKKVTKMVDTGEYEWKHWNWGSESDMMLKGAFPAHRGQKKSPEEANQASEDLRGKQLHKITIQLL